MIKFLKEMNLKKIKNIDIYRSIKNRQMRMIAFAMALLMFFGLILWDASMAQRARAAGADVTETPHAIMVGNIRLAVVDSYSEGETAIKLVKEVYGADGSEVDCIVSPAITIKPVVTVAGEKDPEVMGADEAAEAILKKNSGDDPIFTVAVKHSGISKISVPYKTKTVKDSDLEKGKTKVVTEGKNGVSLLMGDTVTVNGVQKKADILETKVIKEPTTKVIHEGTKEKKKKESSSGNSKGKTTGSFTWPLPSSRNVVSGYGGRVGPIYGNEFHMGIDISGSYGAPVVAADGGTVVEAGWHYSYGYQVVIQHSNGLKTRYAHNSSLAVSAGQKVSKGQTISYCGSTGDSVGTHLHFEVWKGGSHVNPYNYL